MAAKETIGDGDCRKYANSQFSDQNRQDAISRVSAVQNSAADETHGHINSACCEGMATTVMAAHHSICRNLYDAAQKPKSKLKFVIFDKENNMCTL